MSGEFQNKSRNEGKHIKHVKKKVRDTKKIKAILLNVLITLFLILFVAGALFANIQYNRTNYTAEFYQLNSRKLNHSIRIVFLTDVHLREYGEDNDALLKDIQNLAPDLIILGGDLVNDNVSGYDNMLSLCSHLTQIAPVCGVLGNHEDVMIYQQGDNDLVQRFEDTGVHILRNEEATYELYGNIISILGVEGNPGAFTEYGAKEFMDAAEQETDYDFRVCVAHIPTYFPDQLTDYSYELALAGHTHGGIVQIPKLGPLYSKEEGFFPDYASGSYALSNGAILIVSRGLGDSSEWPRINNVPELSVIDID